MKGLLLLTAAYAAAAIVRVCAVLPLSRLVNVDDNVFCRFAAILLGYLVS